MSLNLNVRKLIENVKMIGPPTLEEIQQHLAEVMALEYGMQVDPKSVFYVQSVERPDVVGVLTDKLVFRRKDQPTSAGPMTKRREILVGAGKTLKVRVCETEDCRPSQVSIIDAEFLGPHGAWQRVEVTYQINEGT